MTRVLITGIGGSIGIDLARSLRQDGSIEIIGADGSEWGRRLGSSLCDSVVSLPRADTNSAEFIEVLDGVIRNSGVDFVFINPDTELQAVAENDYIPETGHALPPPIIIGICLDKSRTVDVSSGNPDFPRTVRLETEQEIDGAFRTIGSPLWLRATVGAGGRGSIAVENVEEASAWIRYWRARGRADRWMAQEYLPGRNFNWTGFYADGQLLVATAMERLKYFLAEPAVSGVSGQVALCATVDPGILQKRADRAVRLIDARPAGFYSVDVREDSEGSPRVTEVNPRLAGRPWLYTNAGVNLPLYALRSVCGLPIGDAVAEEGMRIGLHEYRQLDIEPVIGTPGEADG